MRGLDFAREVRGRKGSKINRPFVIGAVISLGLCLDLSSAAGVEQLRESHRILEEVSADRYELPRTSREGLLRPLDCAVIPDSSSNSKRTRRNANRHGQGRVHRGRADLRRLRLLRKNPHPNRGLQSRLHQGSLSRAGRAASSDLNLYPFGFRMRGGLPSSEATNTILAILMNSPVPTTPGIPSSSRSSFAGLRISFTAQSRIGLPLSVM